MVAYFVVQNIHAPTQRTLKHMISFNRLSGWVILLWSLTIPFGMAQTKSTTSFHGNTTVAIRLTPKGEAFYSVSYQNRPVINSSKIGFLLKDQPPLTGNFTFVSVQRSYVNENWQPVWGQRQSVRNEYKQLFVQLREKTEPFRLLNVYLRAYEDGFALRYEFPEQPAFKDFVVMDELTEFAMTADHTAWWIPGDWDSDEHWFKETKLSEIDATDRRDNPFLVATYIPDVHAVNTPMTMKSPDGLYLSLHEAALYNYPMMTLSYNRNAKTFKTALVSSPDGSKAKLTTPFQTPWRFGIIGKRAGDLIESYLIYNLNEPSKLTETTWIKPMKYMGIWWEMHVDKGTWDMESGRHSATTANAKRYIDFASRYGIPGLLIEGWNVGWDRWIGPNRRPEPFDFQTPYADFDLEDVVRYGREKGVSIIGHHETSAVITGYEKYMDAGYRLYNRLGIPAVKSGYVGKIIPQGEYHGGQWMVQHYQRSVEATAAARLMLDIHEPIHPTGIARTYPNLVSAEGMCGQEFNAWSTGNPVEHNVILPFTRNLAGPMDFTPGIFDVKLLNSKNNGQDPNSELKNRIRSTLAHQLALYVVFYSPIQMAADLPENYQDHPAFRFIADVAVDWQQTRVLDAEIGRYLTTIRKAKNSDEWFLGSITNGDPRTLTVPLDCLDRNRTYVATLYLGGDDADWKQNPTSYQIRQYLVTAKDRLAFRLASGGGAAMRFKPATTADQETIPAYR